MKTKLLIISVVILTGCSCFAGILKGNVDVISDDVQVKVALSARNSGKGTIRINEEGSLIAKINVKYTKFDDGYAWLGGKCTSGDYEGQWFFAAVNDGGKPAELVDHLWWEWLGSGGEQDVKNKVENIEIPAESKSIVNGDIVIK